ncbi:MAG TPA: hypothetical protein VF297_05095 [Pyrinomonadaceae bacterium]
MMPCAQCGHDLTHEDTRRGCTDYRGDAICRDCHREIEVEAAQDEETTMIGPWFITPSAVRDYLRIRGWSESDYERGLADLIEISTEVVAEGKQPTEIGDGRLRYRTGRARGRMGLVINEYPQQEGDLPQLLAVIRSMR